ncbi:MAG: hypothetical protein AB9888_13335 [Bacteroidales bacterium]
MDGSKVVAAGWHFAAAITSPSPAPAITVTPSDGNTSALGTVNFKWNPGGVNTNINITETPHSGYDFQGSVACTKDGSGHEQWCDANYEWGYVDGIDTNGYCFMRVHQRHA